MGKNDIDVLFRNATVIDGTGGAGYRADVAVAGGRVAAIARQLEPAAVVIEADGKVLAPGFIDVHTHDDTHVIREPQMVPKITQGVTTVIAGNCGISACLARIGGEVPDPMNLLGEREHFTYPALADYRAAVDAARPAVNVATLVGHTTLRNNHLDDLGRPATAGEIEAMRFELRQALREGALGLSTGLAYAAAFAAPTEEVMALAEELAACGGLYATHLRSEFDDVIEAMEEAFAIGRHARAPVVASHHKCAGVRNWGRTTETLALLDRTRQSQEVACDCYPYAASSSTLDLKQVTADFDIVVTWSNPHPEMAGRTLQEVAEAWGLSLLEAARRLRPAGAVYHNMDEADVRRVLRYSHAMIGSDGLPDDPLPHPRLWGTFPRVLGRYSRELGLFPLPEAVRKMTGLSAERFGLRQRGRIREGYFADLVLFDPQTVADRATFGAPQVPAAGIELVMVNGVIALQDGRLTGRCAGRFLPREAGEGDQGASS